MSKEDIGTVKETGIIMSGNHPKLIMDGLKTQSRRVIKPQPFQFGRMWVFKDIRLSIKASFNTTLSCHRTRTPYSTRGRRRL